MLNRITKRTRVRRNKSYIDILTAEYKKSYYIPGLNYYFGRSLCNCYFPSGAEMCASNQTFSLLSQSPL
ncbi:MAG: hypothetical protein JWR72_2628 [Flavisolibacter sp.]|jgi:hypothetical protein|nr:hypothetical protein [Flavisolibacter sp.]